MPFTPIAYAVSDTSGTELKTYRYDDGSISLKLDGDEGALVIFLTREEAGELGGILQAPSSIGRAA